MAIDEETIRFNVGRLFDEALRTKSGMYNYISANLMQFKNKAQQDAETDKAAGNTTAVINPLELMKKDLQDKAVTGNFQINHNNNQLAQQALNVGMDFVPGAGYIQNAASKFGGIGNVFSGIWKIITVTFSYFFQKPDARGKTKTLTEVWEAQTRADNLEKFGQLLGISDPNFVKELTKPAAVAAPVARNGAGGFEPNPNKNLPVGPAATAYRSGHP